MAAAVTMIGQSQIAAPEQEDMAMGYTFLLWGSTKWMGIYRSPLFSVSAAAAAVVSPSIAEVDGNAMAFVGHHW